MGQQASHTLVAAVEDIDTLVSTPESLNSLFGSVLEFEKSLGSSRFMKSACYKYKSSEYIVLKMFQIPAGININFNPMLETAQSNHQLLKKIDSVFSYSKVIINENYVFLARQYLKFNLYDRLSTRPFLTVHDKIWIIVHGDLKLENVLLTSWNWIFLSDFAFFKPVFIPSYDPTEFAFFFDLSSRRACYNGGLFSSNTNTLQPSMDIFSMGCIIAELFLEDSPLFNFSQILLYKSGSYDVSQRLDSIPVPQVKELILHMIQLNPESRLSASERGSLFLESFYDTLYLSLSRVSSITPNNSHDLFDLDDHYVNIPKLSESIVNINESLWIDQIQGEFNCNICDNRINQIFHDWDYLSEKLEWGKFGRKSLNNQLPSSSCLISAKAYLWFIVSHYKHSRFSTSCRKGILLIKHLSILVDSETVMEYILPNLVEMFHHYSATVRATAISCVAQMLSEIPYVDIVDMNIFCDYLMPYLLTLSTDKEEIVLVALARYLIDFAEASERFIGASSDRNDISGLGSSKIKKILYTNNEVFLEITTSLLTGSQSDSALNSEDIKNKLEYLQPFIRSCLRNLQDLSKRWDLYNHGFKNLIEYGITLHTVFLSPSKNKFGDISDLKSDINRYFIDEPALINSGKKKMDFQERRASYRSLGEKSFLSISHPFVPEIHSSSKNNSPIHAVNPKSFFNGSAGKSETSSKTGEKVSPIVGVSSYYSDPVYFLSKAVANSDSHLSPLDNETTSDASDSVLLDSFKNKMPSSEKSYSSKPETGSFFDQKLSNSHISKTKSFVVNDWIISGKFDHKNTVFNLLSKKSTELPKTVPFAPKEILNVDLGDKEKLSLQINGVLGALLYEHSMPINVIESNLVFRSLNPYDSFNELFLTGGDDGIVRVWSGKSILENVLHKSIATFRQGGKITAALFLSDSKIVSCSDNGSIRIFEIPKHSKVDPLYSNLSRTGISNWNTLIDLQEEFAVKAKAIIKGNDSSGLLIATSSSKLMFLSHETLQAIWSIEIPLEFGQISDLRVFESYFAVVSNFESHVYLIDLRFQIIVKEYTIPRKALITCSHLLQDNQSILFGTTGGDVLKIDLKTGNCTDVFSIKSWANQSFNSDHDPLKPVASHDSIVSIELLSYESFEKTHFITLSQNGIFRVWGLSSYSCLELSLDSPNQYHSPHLVRQPRSFFGLQYESIDAKG
ncbi:hypothetical protein BB560_005390 [Smittium megazygosporum]|uniref:non-specific serine/threonine protein kinase n=1 Tax=Smittium megazygosporum TaxID=133381 RepID=A0A2T9Z6L8_9FUNG|nr:hypothetical protein BB560_005390 [Smittium megazygosporum]